MFGVSRRLSATLAAVATSLVLTTGAVSAADPDTVRSARANASSTGGSVLLGAKSHRVSDGRVDLDHGGGLQLPATDIEPEAAVGLTPASNLRVALATWILVFAAGALASLKYMARRSRL